MKFDRVDTTSISGPLSGNASTASKFHTSINIGGVSFDGTADINLNGVNQIGNQNTSNNASSASKFETSRKIGGVDFDGSANIDLNGVNKPGNQDTTGTADTATKFKTARTIGGVSFDGSASIDLPGVNIAGNQDTTGNAATMTKLKTARYIGGNIFGGLFDGSADIDLYGVNVFGFAGTTGNADTADTTYYIDGQGTVNTTTGTFSDYLTSPSFKNAAYIRSHQFTDIDGVSVTNNSSVVVLSVTSTIPNGVRLNLGSDHWKQWKVLVDIRWFGELGPYSSENVMWDIRLRIQNYNNSFSLSYTVSDEVGAPYALFGTNRNIGCSIHAINYWWNHGSTPEVVNLSHVFDVYYMFSDAYYYKVDLIAKNRAGNTITIATNRTMTDTDHSDYERGNSNITVRFYSDE